MPDLKRFVWSPAMYKRQIEATTFPMLREYEDAELDFILKIPDLKKKTFVDVGAGYGRVLKNLVRKSRNVFAVEIDPYMYEELEKVKEKVASVEVIKGDANMLVELISESDVRNPVVVCLQNTIGPWIGDWRKGLKQMKKVAESRNGEVIISFFRQEAFRKYAIDMYTSVKEVVGEPDLTKCDSERGIFASKTGYRSRWWTKTEREEMKNILGGILLSETKDKPYCIMHFSYS